MKHSPIIYNLTPEFYDPVAPANFANSNLRWFNTIAAETLGLAKLSQEEIKDHFWKFKTFKENIRDPLALRYHGHQFRHYNPDLGDGRGFLLAQFQAQNKIYDLSTKGSGPTPYSRRGDGKLTLKGALREVLATELLESLGVNTSKTFCIFETGENLERGDEPSPTRSAVLTRMVYSSIRFGTFQRLDYFEKYEEMELLAQYCIDNYYSDLKEPKISLFYQAVAKKTADLAAQLMTAGFVHAVLNTDNMNITGEVFDFGPYRFLPFYNPYFTAAYFDHEGLYCYGKQPESFLWGLEQLGNCLVKIDPNLKIDFILQEFIDEFNQRHKHHFFRRLNLSPQHNDLDNDLDNTLIAQFYQVLSNRHSKLNSDSQKGFEQTFFEFYGGQERQGWKSSNPLSNPLSNSEEHFIETLKNYKVARPQYLQHPYFSSPYPETLLIQDIESIWQPITLCDDWSEFDLKIQKIRAFRGVYM